MKQLSELLPPEFLKNIIVGVGVDDATRDCLINLATDSDGEYYDVSNHEI